MQSVNVSFLDMLLAENFDAQHVTHDADGAAASFANFSAVLQCIEAQKNSGTGYKDRITKLLANYLSFLLVRHPVAVMPFICISTQEVKPFYVKSELGVGETALLKAISAVCSIPEATVHADMKRVGDLGKAFSEYRVKRSVLFKPKPLSVMSVFDTINNIYKEVGASSNTRRQGLIEALLIAASPLEGQYIIRVLSKSLRIGIQNQTVLSVVAKCFLNLQPRVLELNARFEELSQILLYEGVTSAVLEYTKRFQFCEQSSDAIRAYADDWKANNFGTSSFEELLKQFYSTLPNIWYIVFLLCSGAPLSVVNERCTLRCGVPVSPMLAKSIKSFSELIDLVARNAIRCEYKYDGERIQIHCHGDKRIDLFSRNLETLRDRFPDVQAAFARFSNVSCILDGEVVAVDSSGVILPFQTLSNRKRKLEENETAQVNVMVFLFDCLYCEGESLLDRELTYRLAALQRLFGSYAKEKWSEPAGLQVKSSFVSSQRASSIAQIALATGDTVTDINQLQAFFEESVRSSTEGLVVKMLEGPNATYQSAKRNNNWLKLKKDYIEGLGDSFDLVLIGAFRGRGRRSKHYGSFLLAVYDKEDGIMRSICKVATGFNDDDLAMLSTAIEKNVVSEMPGNYRANIMPDVWVTPELIFEVRAANISASPTYNAAETLRDKGLSLRFPRFVRLRTDKNIQQCSSSAAVCELYTKFSLNSSRTNL